MNCSISPIDRVEIERSVWHLDEPTTDPSILPFMLICAQARRYVKVCFSGDGGDELLMGYDRFRASKAASLLDCCRCHTANNSIGASPI